MRKIVIDGNKIDSRETLFAVLKEQLQTEDFIGNNLDALHDVLTEFGETVELEVKNPGAFTESLGEYASRFLCMFRDL